MFLRSMIRLRDIKDGTSCTYLAGEKYLSPDGYNTSTSMGSDQSWDHGCDYDVCRFTRYLTAATGGPIYYPPRQDQPGYNDFTQFGGPHANSFNMVMCDGSVQGIPYTIDPAVHNYLGCRADGHVVTPTNYTENAA